MRMRNVSVIVERKLRLFCRVIGSCNVGLKSSQQLAIIPLQEKGSLVL